MDDNEVLWGVVEFVEADAFTECVEGVDVVVVVDPLPVLVVTVFVVVGVEEDTINVCAWVANWVCCICRYCISVCICCCIAHRYHIPRHTMTKPATMARRDNDWKLNEGRRC